MEDFVEDSAHRPSTIDNFLDEILPEELEWERLVRSYPLPAVAVAAVGGLLLGLSHGSTIAAAVSSYVAAQVSRNVSQVLGHDVEQDI
ncbi:MAG: hypothetical protein ABUL63_03245 [Acidobacteriota bacterium]